MDFIKNIKFDEKGLVPAVVQDAETGAVLMMAYMNEESLLKTVETKETWFFSRSRNEFWNKGATSGNTQAVVEMSYDCDGDTILVKVIQKGVACHTGEYSCFFNKIVESESGASYDVLDRLYALVKDRKENPVEESYTNYLFDKGVDKILKKVGEESAEVIIGAKNDSAEEVIYESSDLVYHMVVLLVQMGISISDIKKELSSRYK
ncbi:phosphoribosyl-ATP pyrophosphatase [Andreesenia angusta]|uniref:Histidine biosynthesis bifunctional protein HisIE n=1 Tax=Andreesenia angusta TaxID=39480 RepID=A0A1S1V7V7_9FIRM|nr:bifunctional phosphoribosyl-AMP cyclohydrolase/phosphoribosyl-ATP diphosphatase HisIE [Andreesenia angusta]OHW62247.1 phosphoribosyl-ATP pyrophosphatase [Andreesenia angusta]